MFFVERSSIRGKLEVCCFVSKGEDDKGTLRFCEVALNVERLFLMFRKNSSKANVEGLACDKNRRVSKAVRASGKQTRF